MFVLTSKITVTPPADSGRVAFSFSGVTNVRIRRSIKNFSDECTVTLPTLGKILRKNGKPDAGLIQVSGVVEVGDAISVALGYNMRNREEFAGFVKMKVTGRRLELICEGYVRQMRLNINLNATNIDTTAKELLLMAAGQIDERGKKIAKPTTDIKVICDYDFPINNLTLRDVNGVALCNKIKELSQNTIGIFFMRPNVLWSGLVYTPYASGDDVFGSGKVRYRLGYNCPLDNSLRQRVPVEKVSVRLLHIKATGQRVYTEGQFEFEKRKEVRYVKNVPSPEKIKGFAREQELKGNYTGYEGSFTTFLEPACSPGYQVELRDSRYPERDGSYLAETVEVSFGQYGARREITVGPQIGFGKLK